MAGLFKKFCGIASIIAIAALCGGSPGLVTSASAEALKIGILLPGSVTDGGYNADDHDLNSRLQWLLSAQA